MISSKGCTRSLVTPTMTSAEWCTLCSSHMKGNTVLHDVIQVVGQIVGKEHRDRERNEREMACLSGGLSMSARQARKQ